MTQHTPGPWKAQGAKVTNQTGSHFIGDFGPSGDPECCANAKLAVAADALLEGSKFALPLFREMLGKSGTLLSVIGRAKFEAWVAAIEAAESGE